MAPFNVPAVRCDLADPPVGAGLCPPAQRGLAGPSLRASCGSPLRRLCQCGSLLLLALALSLALTGCFGIQADPTPAATVNGEAIYEEEVTSYVEGFRSKYDDYATDDGWASYLAESGYTPESFRSFVLNEVFIPKLIVRQQCEERNIKVTDEILDDVIERERQYYESRYGEDSWTSVLSSYGYDEQSWRENEEDRLLEEQLADEVLGEVTASKAQVQSWANDNAATYNGKHSLYIEFESEEAASAARDGLEFNARGKTTKKRFKKLGKTENAGWSSLSSDADALGNDYTSVLNELGTRCVSEPVQTGEGYCLIFCDRTYSAEDDDVDLSNMPSAIYREVAEQASEELKSEKFDEWLSGVTEQAQVVITEMPDNLSYDTDLTLGSS